MTKEHPMSNPPLLDLGLEPRTQVALEFVYVGDPMCSWCWGFSPALEKLDSRYGIPLRVCTTPSTDPVGSYAQAIRSWLDRTVRVVWRISEVTEHTTAGPSHSRMFGMANAEVFPAPGGPNTTTDSR
jgi:hypothetical protein